MKRFVAIIALLSVCYMVSAGSWDDWKKGLSQCDLCIREMNAFLTDFKLARNIHPSSLNETCNKYPTPEGSCPQLLNTFDYVYDKLESRLVAQEHCAYFGICTSVTSIDTSDPNIPAVPITPKDSSKVYDNDTCYKCNITAAVTYNNVGNYANSMNAMLENSCLSWVKTGPVPTRDEYNHCKTDYMAKVFDQLTDFVVKKTSWRYLCQDLFDMCSPEK